MRMRHWVSPLLLATALLGPLMAQAPNTGASAITPYVDNQTLLAGRLDVSKIDTAAIETYINQMLADQHVQVPDEMRQGISMGRMAADGMLARFKALGGDRVYVLVSFPDAWPAMQPLAVLIPIGAGGDIQGMEALVKSLPVAGPQPANGQASGVTIEPLNDHLLYAGSTVAYKRLQTIHAQPRPDLETALAGSSSAASVVIAPTADMRRVVAEMMPRLPDAIGGGPTDAMAKDLVNITLDVNLPPKPEITLAAHTGTSTGAAQSIADLGTRWIAMLRADNGFKQAFGPGGEQAAMATEVNALLDALEPKGAHGCQWERPVIGGHGPPFGGTNSDGGGAPRARNEPHSRTCAVHRVRLQSAADRDGMHPLQQRQESCVAHKA